LNIIYKSNQMSEIMDIVERISQTKATVLIMGESGTGKDLIAQYIHNSSSRSEGPFVPINCAAIPKSLFESEFFGYEKGAFTGSYKMRKGHFEESNGGTLFLDEIAEIPFNFQAKLLRALQTKHFQRLGSSKPIKTDIRIIASTNQDIKQRVKDGEFREDLFFRLNVIPITIPPLRDRHEDISLLIKHFIDKYAREHKTLKKTITKDAFNMLMDYDFPGNVRELENLIERAMILSKNRYISVNDILISNDNNFRPSLSKGLKENVQNLEKGMIKKALKKSNYVKVNAAKELEISERVLRYKIKKYNILE